jgi:hypothetical protein
MVTVQGLEDARDTAIINRNVATLDAQLAANLGHRDPFTLDLPRAWHTAIHAGCAHIPRPDFVGHYRGEPIGGLRLVDNWFGAGRRFKGAPSGEVLARLGALGTDVQRKLETWDGRIKTAGDATPARLNPVIEGVTAFYATWLRIHPFADGNGRTARVLVNWVATRYWQPPILPGRPVADAESLVVATTPAIPETNPNYRPLVLHLRRRLQDARAAAARRS